MGGLKGEAGESPALSRNGNSPDTVKRSATLVSRREARSPAPVGFHALAEGSGNAQTPRIPSGSPVPSLSPVLRAGAFRFSPLAAGVERLATPSHLEEVRMSPSRRFTFVLLALLMALAVAACAQATPTPTPTPLPPTATPVPPMATAVPNPTPVPPTPTPTPITLTDGLGHTVTLAQPAQRIVALAPSVAESLFAIGAGGQVVAREDNTTYPPEAAQLPSVGSLWGGLPLEAILSYQPDLVVVAEITSPEDVQKMQDAGLTVFWQANPKTFDDLYHNLRDLALLTGHQDEAEALITQLQERVQIVTQALADVQDEPSVFYELDATDPSNPWTTGPGTFISYTIQLAKGRNVGDVLDKPWAQISVETLVQQDPDIILLADAPYGVTPEAVAQRAGWDALTAVKEGRVYPFDPKLLSVPGPRLVDGLETLAVMLHPDAFCAADWASHLNQDLLAPVCQP